MENKETEYATQFFEFIPKSFCDELNEEFNDLISEALGVIKMKLKSKYQGKVLETEVDQSVQIVEDKYLLEVDTAFEKLSTHITSHVLRVPRHVLLPEDEIWEDVKTTEVVDNLAKTKSATETLRSKIKTAKYKKTVLAESLQNIQDICEKQESNIKAYEELLSTFNVTDWMGIVELTLENRKSQTKMMKALDEQTDFNSESFCSLNQQSINSKNSKRIIGELLEYYRTLEPQD